MIVLIKDGVVIARGIEYVVAAEAKGFTGNRVFLPDDTAFDRVDGRYVIADDQPNGWPGRKVAGESYYGQVTNQYNSARTRKPKLDSTAGLVERVARLELLLSVIPEDRDG